MQYRLPISLNFRPLQTPYSLKLPGLSEYTGKVRLHTRRHQSLLPYTGLETNAICQMCRPDPKIRQNSGSDEIMGWAHRQSDPKIYTLLL